MRRVYKSLNESTRSTDFNELLREINGTKREMRIFIYNSPNPSKSDEVFSYTTDASVYAVLENGKLWIETRGGDIKLSLNGLVNIDYNALSITGKDSPRALFTDVVFKDRLYKFLFRE